MLGIFYSTESISFIRNYNRFGFNNLTENFTTFGECLYARLALVIEWRPFLSSPHITPICLAPPAVNSMYLLLTCQISNHLAVAFS